MSAHVEALRKCLFFHGKTPAQITEYMAEIGSTSRTYQKNEIIVTEGDPAGFVGIVLSGQVEVQKIHPSGSNITIARLGEGQTFGEAVVFSRRNRFPATVVAPEACTVELIAKSALLRLFALDPDILSHYMANMSERLLMLNQKIEILSLGTLRQRIAYSLLKLSGREQAARVILPYNKRVWAEHLGAARPSLSRELAHMREQGWIDYDGNRLDILDRDALESLLL